jgi:MoaA/NifB/PqqE/SkfB family radical SAM enzyme
MGAWAALLGEKRTEEQLAAMRAESAEPFGITEFTCDKCPARYTCEWAFDAYNTNGDCLAEK